jgi:hypothetical protein
VKPAESRPDGWYACPDGHAHKFVAGRARCLCGAFGDDQAGEPVLPTHARSKARGAKYRQKPPHPQCVDANRKRWLACF